MCFLYILLQTQLFSLTTFLKLKLKCLHFQNTMFLRVSQYVTKINLLCTCTLWSKKSHRSVIMSCCWIVWTVYDQWLHWLLVVSSILCFAFNVFYCTLLSLLLWSTFVTAVWENWNINKSTKHYYSMVRSINFYELKQFWVWTNMRFQQIGSCC